MKKHQNSSDASIVEQPKLKKKKTPAQVARDYARQKAYWKNVKVAKKLRAENLAAHNKLQETKTVPSSQVSVPAISQPEKSGCLEMTALVSESNSCVTINTAQAQSDLHELSAEVAESEKSSILLDTSDELDFRKHLLNQFSKPDSDEDSSSPSVCGNCMKKDGNFGAALVVNSLDTVQRSAKLQTGPLTNICAILCRHFPACATSQAVHRRLIF